jgi:hypothetical protein
LGAHLKDAKTLSLKNMPRPWWGDGDTPEFFTQEYAPRKKSKNKKQKPSALSAWNILKKYDLSSSFPMTTQTYPNSFWSMSFGSGGPSSSGSPPPDFDLGKAEGTEQFLRRGNYNVGDEVQFYSRLKGKVLQGLIGEVDRLECKFYIWHDEIEFEGSQGVLDPRSHSVFRYS